MRRLDNVWDSFVETDNFCLAAKNACRSRRDKIEVAAFKDRWDELLTKLIEDVKANRFRSSRYRMFEVHEKDKTRLVADLPLYPDRILHWAIALAIEEQINRKLIDQTHASRPNHGIHSAISDVRKYLDKDSRIKYALQIDVRKFFPSMDKEMVKKRLREVLKDERMLMLLDSIIDDYPYPGIAIGNRVSPMFANMVLSPIDHIMKERYHCHYYVRYMDDIVILGYSKPWLHKMRNVLDEELKKIGLTIKDNWQVYPIDSRGIQFVGYRLYTTHTLVRKNVKHNLKRKSEEIWSRVEKGRPLDFHDKGSIASYEGMLKWCDGKHLQKTTFGKIRKRVQKNEEEWYAGKAYRSFMNINKEIFT